MPKHIYRLNITASEPSGENLTGDHLKTEFWPTVYIRSVRCDDADVLSVSCLFVRGQHGHVLAVA